MDVTVVFDSVSNRVKQYHKRCQLTQQNQLAVELGENPNKYTQGFFPRIWPFGGLRIVSNECLGRDVLRWKQVPRLFAVLFTMTAFFCLFYLLTKLEDRKGYATFCGSFGDFLASKTQKGTAKGHASFFVLQKDAKKTPKGCKANFVLQMVGNLF